MTTIDIRKDSVETIDEIVFYDEGCTLIRQVGAGASIECDTCEYFYALDSREEAENLIKALQKALELGWFGD